MSNTTAKASWEKVSFYSGELALEGLLWEPTATRAPEGFIVVTHPHPLYGGDMHNSVVTSVSETLCELDLPILRFNFRGAGESDGVHDGTAEVDDLSAAIAFMEVRYGKGSQLNLVGYSYGAFIDLVYLEKNAKVRKVALIAPPLGIFDLSTYGKTEADTLVIHGDRDMFAPNAKMEKWLESLPDNVKSLEIPRADHFFFGRDKEVSQVILGYLRIG